MAKCLIWETDATRIGVHGKDAEGLRSARAGGEYIASRSSIPSLQSLDAATRIKLTNFIVDQNRLGGGPAQIFSTTLDTVRANPSLSVVERRDRLLLYLQSKPENIGTGVPIGGTVTPDFHSTQLELLAWTCSLNPNEYSYLIDSCRNDGLVDHPGSDRSHVRLTIKGYEHVSELGFAGVNSEQAFVAMWFDQTMEEAYALGIEPAIRESGYRALRVDKKEHINKIDDEIIAEIRRSRFVVADFTSETDKPRGGVYFEAGFAQGLNLPVIWTCRNDQIDQVHFDTRQFNHIVWSDPGDLLIKMKNRIGAVIGDGPLIGIANGG